MTTTGTASFDRTVQETNLWLKDVEQHLGPDRQHAYHATRATLHALRDRLPVDEAAHLGAQLPMLLRGIYYEGWRPSATPQKMRSRDEFLTRIQEELGDIGPINVEAAARAVLDTLRQRVSPGEVQDVFGALLADIRSLAGQPA